MSGLMSNAELVAQLEAMLPQCKNLTIISAFVTQPAISWLGNLIDHEQSKVQIVGRFTPNDFISGASDINALRVAIARDYEVKALENLHAKIYQIDRDTIFNGSANLTGKGLALLNNGNLESCSKVNACEDSLNFIEKIIESSVSLDLGTLDKMQDYLSQMADNIEDCPLMWPEDVLSKSTELFVSDFPLGRPGLTVEEYDLNPSLTFAQIENLKGDYHRARAIFKSSKAYKWLYDEVVGNDTGRDFGFGYMSNSLHEKLSDDPAPYRREIKDLLANLYLYIKFYASDEIEIYVPGGRSEVIRLVS